jgi:WD40 repeat protein
MCVCVQVQLFESGHDYITDVQWSPSNSCVFGTISRDGRVEIWDIDGTNSLDPIIKHPKVRVAPSSA